MRLANPLEFLLKLLALFLLAIAILIELLLIQLAWLELFLKIIVAILLIIVIASELPNGDGDGLILLVEDKPTNVAGAEIPNGKKIVFLIAGAQPYDVALVYDKTRDKYTLAQKPAGFEGKELTDFFKVQQPMGNAWTAISDRYNDANFKKEAWVTITLWPHEDSKSAIFATLKKISDSKPVALIVHYVGHGDENNNGPCLEIEQSRVRKDYPGNPLPTPPKKYEVSVPTPFGRTCVCSLKELADEIKRLFKDPNPKTPLPKTLIVDGCDCAPAIENKAWDEHFFEIMAVDIPHQETVFVKFTQEFASLAKGNTPFVTPDLFEKDFPTKMPPIITALNGKLAEMGAVATVAAETGLRSHPQYQDTQQATIDKTRKRKN